LTLEALLFDVDGTLADTEEVHRAAFNAAFRAAGLGWEWEPGTYKRLLKVTGGKERIRHYVAACHPELAVRPDLDALVTSLHQAKTRYYNDRVSTGQIPLRPGVARLLEEARSAGLRLAIATTTTPENVESLLESMLGREGLQWFEVIRAGDCVPAKKPAPDIYHRVLHEMGLSASACLAFEDSANGLKASLAAHLATLVTVSRYTEGESFAGAVAVLSDLGEPGEPFRVLTGKAYGRSYVDMELLRRWHASSREAWSLQPGAEALQTASGIQPPFRTG
jgi:beta-phosphoglucomutase-like phosphatase (HAD superfamily)